MSGRLLVRGGALVAVVLLASVACSSDERSTAGDGGAGSAGASASGGNVSSGGSSSTAGGSRGSTGGNTNTGGSTGSGGASHADAGSSAGGASGSRPDAGPSTPDGGDAGSSVSVTCVGKANTPGGPDPWGTCFPGEYNTGYPHGLPGDTRAPVTLKNYTGPCTIRTDGTVIDGVRIDNCSGQGLFVYAKNVTIKNSLVNTPIYENADTASITVMDTEVNGGDQTTFPTIGGANNVTAIRVNSHDGEHTVQCYSNCDVEDSWLHDQFDAGSGPHQNGFLSNGGSGFTIRHNSVDCHSSGCTAGITFIPDGNVSKATVQKNLLVASSPNAGYCMDVASDHPAKPGVVSEMTVTDNVFQRGTHAGQHGGFVCGYYGAVGGWDQPVTTPGSDGYMNAWSNNRFDDGTVINP